MENTHKHTWTYAYWYDERNEIYRKYKCRYCRKECDVYPTGISMWRYSREMKGDTFE